MTPLHVLREFDPPDPDWLPGHRGLDVAARPGSPVRSPREGVVSWVGEVAGTPGVSVRHGVSRATYQPVRASVHVGDSVAPGTVLGEVAEVAEVGGAAHCRACLHWGLRKGESYLDPRLLLGRPHAVLIPVGDG